MTTPARVRFGARERHGSCFISDSFDETSAAMTSVARSHHSNDTGVSCTSVWE